LKRQHLAKPDGPVPNFVIILMALGFGLCGKARQGDYTQ
jgi:hypothetical protein